MLIKVCGLFDSENIAALQKLDIDMMGFIFYASSPRNAFNADPEFVSKIQGLEKVAVFVNESLNIIQSLCEKYAIKSVQLHGKESVELISQLKEAGYFVTKAISISTIKDLAQIATYDSICDRILLDTKCDSHGGSGKKFDWSILNAYIYKTPFMLSGGISPDDAADILKIHHPKLLGVDINSRFELQNNLKDTQKIKKFIERIRNEQID